MSARLLKKVLQEQEAALRQQQQLSSGDESDSPDTSAPSLNPFDLLDDDDKDENGYSDQESEAGIADRSSTSNDGKHPSVAKAGPQNVSVRNHKPNKKKKKKTKKVLSLGTGDDEDLSHLMLEDLSLGAGSHSHEETVPGAAKAKSAKATRVDMIAGQRKSSILQIDPKFLSAENELRRIFGSKVVNSFERSHQAGSSRQTRGSRRGIHNHRRTLLVSPCDHWPRWDGSLSMELLETREGVHYFRYVHSSSYGQAQRAFEAAKAIHDLNGIASTLLYHPYHVESLITLAEYFQFSGEHQMAADAISKSLYALECAWHPMFYPLQGNCQLKYNHETNKPFFLSLFTHMKNMDRRGCHRSALEICKLLLSLDSDDPMGALFCIDYYALRAEEYAWLEHFSDEYKHDNSLWLFPNFSYSLAVCRFYLESGECQEDGDMDSGKAASSDLMKQALMLHPIVLKKLIAKVPLKEAVWTTILKHNFFGSAQTGGPTLDHLTKLYVERSYLLWRLPDLQKFLRDSALSVIETMKENVNDARDWACVRNEAFPSEKNEYSHLAVSDFSDSVPTMPPDNLQNFMMDMRGVAQNAEGFPNPPVDLHVPPDISGRNALAVLFESILPWVNYGRGNDEDLQHEHHDEQPDQN